MNQNIDTIPIIRLWPEYIKKTIKEKTGLLQNKTKTVKVNDSLDYSSMKEYPSYVIQSMEQDFENTRHHQSPLANSVSSVQYTLEQFRKQHLFCKIISVVKHNGTICIVWEMGN